MFNYAITWNSLRSEKATKDLIPTILKLDSYFPTCI